MKLQHLNHSKELADRSLQVTGNDVERHGLTRARQQLENRQAFLQRRSTIFWVCGVSHAAMILQSGAILPVKSRVRGLCSPLRATSPWVSASGLDCCPGGTARKAVVLDGFRPHLRRKSGPGGGRGGRAPRAPRVDGVLVHMIETLDCPRHSLSPALAAERHV